MIFPVFSLKGKKINLQIKKIERLGFKKIEPESIGCVAINELIYERPYQKSPAAY